MAETDQPADDALPYLPPAQPVAPTPVVPAPTDPSAAIEPRLAAPRDVGIALPAEPEFDAKAMVESQRRGNANPAYGSMPTTSAQSREAVDKLRKTASRKRRRNRTFGWFVATAFAGLIGVAGFLAYQSYSDEQDADTTIAADNRSAAEILEDLEAGDGEAGAGPLGEQQAVLDGIDSVSDGGQSGAGGLLGAVDDAREVAGDLNGETGDTPATLPPVAVVLPDVVLTNGVRLLDVDGRQTYSIDGDLFETNEAALQAFVAALIRLPQADPTSPNVAAITPADPNEVVISVAANGDTVTALVVAWPFNGLYIDTTTS